MFCQCYDVAETEATRPSAWRTDVRANRKSTGAGAEAGCSSAEGPKPAYSSAEGNRSAPIARASLDSVDEERAQFTSKDQPRDDNAAVLLRFEDLEAKINWWRAVAQLTTPSQYETADELDQITTAISEEDSDDGDIDEDASTLKKTRQAFEQAVQAFVRPPRARYDISQLGPRAFPFGGSL